jgi:excisionase family DNA binding protein
MACNQNDMGARTTPNSHEVSLHDLVRGRFLNAAQAAEFLGGLNSRTVIRWAREGYLPAYPIGEGKRRLWRFLEEDLDQWMLSRRTGCPDVADATLSRTLYASHRCSDQGRK